MTRKEAQRQTWMANALITLGISDSDVWTLRRISMTLHRWYELECGDSNDYASWSIERDGDEPDSKPYMVRHPYGRHGEPTKSTRTPVADRETGARKRLAAIMAKYPTLTSYVQGDPRGCALYICRRPTDVPTGESLNAYYFPGIAVY